MAVAARGMVSAIVAAAIVVVAGLRPTFTLRQRSPLRSIDWLISKGNVRWALGLTLLDLIRPTELADGWSLGKSDVGCAAT